mmetsp:Transcript_36613/g.118358  ORF Transcript_36613/g.118358 Transcript_36613/m.118358 type:complete len:242 (+) Transcript_36613:328-1053(+)
MSLTSPWKTTPLSITNGPSTVSFVQRSSDGAPSGMSVASWSQNLYDPSSLMMGGTPLRSGASVTQCSGVTSYASLLSASKSPVVLTGAKRERGVRIAFASAPKHWMAAPIAVSSCSTAAEALSRGSTVFLLLITGSGITPLPSRIFFCSASRSSHKLFVLKKRWRFTSAKRASSSSGHCALSRKSSPPVSADLARWPPFLSESVRAATSIAKGAPDCANHVSSVRSIVAPRLSELETNMYL